MAGMVTAASSTPRVVDGHGHGHGGGDDVHGHDPHYPMAEQTDEDHDVGLADAADGGVHVEMPPAEEELPQVVGEKVYRRRGDKKHWLYLELLGQRWPRVAYMPLQIP